MHVLENTSPVNLRNGSFIKPGRWLMSDQNAFEMALLAERTTAKITPRESTYITGDVTDIVLMRSGAIGDLLLMSPAIRTFQAKYPDKRIILCCRPERAGLFDETGLFDDYASYPMPVPEFLHASQCIISLEDFMENNPKIHATDCFAKALGVTVTDYKPSYVVRESERVDAQKYLTRSTRPKIAVQLMASANNRNYPMPLWKKVIDALIINGWHVMLFDSPERTANMNHQKFMTPVVGSFRQNAAVFEGCDAFVGVDSVWSHMCHALDVPGVVVYGAFDPATRTGKNPNITALVGSGPCAPCSHHIHAGHHFPVTEPCAAKNQCSVLASINPATIISAVNQLKP